MSATTTRLPEYIFGEMSVYCLTLVAITNEPKTRTEIYKDVCQMSKRTVHSGSIFRCLERAIAGGAAILIDDKYTEPTDGLSNLKGME